VLHINLYRVHFNMGVLYCFLTGKGKCQIPKVSNVLILIIRTILFTFCLIFSLGKTVNIYHSNNISYFIKCMYMEQPGRKTEQFVTLFTNYLRIFWKMSDTQSIKCFNFDHQNNIVYILSYFQPW
jgi:hypothetical protein